MNIPASAVGCCFPSALSQGPSGTFTAIVLGIVALGLMFAGRSIIKGLAFVVVGFAGAAFGAAAGALILGPLGGLIGIVLGFLLGGLVGVVLVELGMGIALGYFGYLLTRFLDGPVDLVLVVGVVLFIVGLALSTKALELVTAVIGGIVLDSVLIFFGASTFNAAVISLLLAAAGLFVQDSKRRRAQHWRTGV